MNCLLCDKDIEPKINYYSSGNSVITIDCKNCHQHYLKINLDIKKDIWSATSTYCFESFVVYHDINYSAMLTEIEFGNSPSMFFSEIVPLDKINKLAMLL